MSTLILSVDSLPESISLFDLLIKIPGLVKWMDFLLFWEDIFFSTFIALLISAFFYFGSKRREMIPHGLQNFFEYLIENLRKIAYSIIGEEADRHIAFLGTLFIYIFAMNTFSLIPFMKAPSSNLSISIGLALCVFVRVQYLNMKNMGLSGYLFHMCGSPRGIVPWLISPLMFFVELITQISRPITLALRLTGNILGEHALISIFGLLSIAIFSFEGLPFGLPIQIPVMFFSLLTGLMQALVFTLLTAVYILLSIPHQSETH